MDRLRYISSFLAAVVAWALLHPAFCTALTSQELNDQRSLWSSVGWSDYDYVYQRSCYCFGDIIRPGLVQVRDGRVAAVTDVSNQQPLSVEFFPTIDQLFDQLQDALETPAELINVVFDGSSGYPSETFIDYSTLIADEEFGYTATAATDQVAPLGCNLAQDRSCGTEFLDALERELQSGMPDVAFDLTFDGRVDFEDHRYFVTSRMRTYYGDSNLDGQFDSGDLVVVFQKGEYEDAVEGNSSWSAGDWNGDSEFTSADLVLALAEGGYNAGLRKAVAAVPEPAHSTVWLFATLGRLWFRRSGRQ